MTAERGAAPQVRVTSREADSGPTCADGGPGARPRLTFLAYFFPPARTIASVRTLAMAKRLARAGWDVTVVTPRVSVWRRTENAEGLDELLRREGIRSVRVRHPWAFLVAGHTVPFYERIGTLGALIGRVLARGVRRALRPLQVPGEIGWIRAAERAARRLPRPDLVLATGSPFAAFDLARRLARRQHCAYALDYRDLWSQNPHRSTVSGGEEDEEAALLADASVVLAVSSGMAKALDRRFGLGARLHTIENGYDAEELAAIEPTRFDGFAVVYAGQFYPPKRVVDPVLVALRSLETETSDGRTWKFHYYGRHEDHVRHAASSVGLLDRVVFHGDVARREALAATKGAGVAVVIASVASTPSSEDEGIVTGKIFEAIGLRTPILAISPPGDLDAVLATAGLGRRFLAADTSGIATYLRELMAGRKPPARAPETFDWERIGPRLDEALRAALPDARGTPRSTGTRVPR